MKQIIPYIVIVGLLVWVFYLYTRPPEPVEIIREIQVGQERLDSILRVADSLHVRRERDSIRWQKRLNEREKSLSYYKREMGKKRDIEMPEADSLVKLMEE